MTETHPDLVAWFDGELSAAEAAAVARHVESCEACGHQCAAIRDAGSNLQLYCDATLTAALAQHKFSRWVPVFAALAAVTALAILLAFPRKRSVAPAPLPSPVAAVASTPFQSPEPQPPFVHKLAHGNRAVPSAPRPVSPWPTGDTAVEIAIPADAVFAPGALPEGTRLFGEMRIGPDGSLREIRLRQ